MEQIVKELSRVCPICTNNKGTILHTQKFVLDEDNPLPNSYDIVSCIQCSFIYADVEASQEDYNEYYENFSKYESAEISSGSGGNSFDMKRLLETANDIMNHVENKDAKILDIGAAMGGLLNILKQNKYTSLYALEPSKGCVSYMKKEYDLNAYHGGLLDDFNTIFKGEKFDFIILSHVLEHIYDLQKAILNIKSILNENGKVYVEVPDSDRYLEFYVVPYYYFDIEHINHFNKFTLSTFMGNYGYENINSQEKIMLVSESIKYPAFFGVFRLNERSKSSILEYINLSKENGLNNFLKELVLSQEACVVWGAGNYTKRLLAQTDLVKCNISYFVDTDTIKQGKYINGIEIMHPQTLKSFKNTIIVASALYSSDIVKTIKSNGYCNKIIVLGKKND